MSKERTEEWIKEIGWGISTLVLPVTEAEEVEVSSGAAKELGLSLTDARDSVDPIREKLAWMFPYSLVQERLVGSGWVKK